MKRLLATVAIAITGVACLPAVAQAEFGINGFDVTFTNEDGTMATQAGSHPFAMTVRAATNLDSEGHPEEWLRDLITDQMPGLVADTTAYPRCSNAAFLQIADGVSACPIGTAVGITASEVGEPGDWWMSPVFNLEPPPGVLVRLGFTVAQANIVVDVGLSEDEPYRGVGFARNISQVVEVISTRLQLWGDPSHPGHDSLRGDCGVDVQDNLAQEFEFEGTGSCPVEAQPKALLTLPTYCEEPLLTTYEALSWGGVTDSGGVLTHDAGGNSQPFTGCGSLTFGPTMTAVPTTKAAQSASGLDLAIQVDDEGLTSTKEGARSQSRIRRVAIKLPEGMTGNPSLAEGLEVCTEADLDEETLESEPGEGCPQASKIGTIEVESPLVAEPQKGSLYVAKPYDNLADDSLLAFYIVIRNRNLGIVIKQVTKVVPDPETGQLEGIADEIPQLPFSSFRLHFREGGRSPLISPSSCGSYKATAEFTPWSGGPSEPSTSSFSIISGPNGGGCPSPGAPPFEPGFEAGSASNSGGSYSPFSMRLLRRDGDQDLTRFDATLPPGVGAKLAGVGKCPDAAIAQAKAKTGLAERSEPSCPAASRIGSVQGGAGVGSQLTYVPGSIYLAGPYGGAPMSVVAIVPAVAGPFDVGTVVVRQALVVNPRSGQVTADGSQSDPLPHILAGIPLSVREIQVRVDRPEFTYNPTSCDPFATKATIWGGGEDPRGRDDDVAVGRNARFQAASCSRLGFKPKLSLKLKGGTKRGGHPSLRSVYTPRPGDANLGRLVLRLPRSAFLDQAHIRTVCTRVQFAADSCPKGAIYGKARVTTPVLDDPLKGPIYLRSSDNELPDLVLALKGLVEIEAVGRVDSKRGGIRVTFTGVPDAPIGKAVVTMQGGKKGLIINSRDLCAAKHRANLTFDAQSGKTQRPKPVVRPVSCRSAKRR